MECILHMFYRLSLCKWATRESENNMAMKEAKKNVQKEFRKQMILYVDTSEQGSGSTNDGNMARRFFRYSDPLKIIGVVKIFI